MIVQFVEGVEELFLRALLVSQQLDVVDQQNVGCAIALVELLHAIRADAGDHLVHEALAGSVDDPHGAELVHQLAADGVHQMGLSHPHAAVEEQRVIAARRVGGHGPRGGCGELVAGAHHKRIERKFGIQALCGAFQIAPGVDCRYRDIARGRGRSQFVIDVLTGRSRSRIALANQNRKLRLQPVPRSAIWDGNKNRIAIDAGKYGAFQPVVVAFGAHFLLQVLADLIPEIHRHSHTRSTHFPQRFPQQRGISGCSIRKNWRLSLVWSTEKVVYHSGNALPQIYKPFIINFLPTTFDTILFLKENGGFRRAGVTQLVECDLAKVDVAGSNPVSRSKVFRIAMMKRLFCSPSPSQSGGPPVRPRL